MADTFDHLFIQLLDGLQSAEKRHRAAYGSASDNSEWDIADRESAIALRITNWRRTFDTLRTEISGSGAVLDGDISITGSPHDSEFVDELIQSDPLPTQTDDERIGRYVWQKMYDLSISGHKFSEYELLNLHDADWSSQVLNLPHQFFLQTTDNVRNYWKKDMFVFNEVEYRLCMLWYNGQYRGRSQRECFDKWYESLNTDATVELNRNDNFDDKTNIDIKVGKYIREKLRELSHSGYVFSTKQIEELCNAEWSCKTFTYPSRILPFARIVLKSSDISVQTKDEKGYSRYWEEIFTFGEHKFLIISQWYKKDKDSFDNWYNELLFAPRNALMSAAVQIESESQKLGNIIGTKPTVLQLLGKRYAVHSWDDLYFKVCEVLLLHCPYVMALLDKDMSFNYEGQTYFSYIQSEIKYNQKRLSNGLWTEMNISSDDVMSTCHKLLKKCGFSVEKLQVEIVED